MNSCCFESATISVSSNATIKNNVAAHTPEYVHVSEVKEKKRRTFISKETRDFLETAFKLKRSPNSRERKIIAEKCGLTPLQVRVWFTNKRMRSK
ncbi:hypothetical protein PACTADRAFT_42688 [Pachysolen tannophilus NRRL Y-2460]|uniref:Homeobox domain-containing protein n=1 Tax=Pachysolen tannophilus NRRL Y-2460 TaxID=669874 RepID=A0A1E4TTY3_PACTA|nr:hypothetical protein PACTADRAFT_42688 [Pachysolen tannophilus NRRL Y-2460]